MSSDLLGAFGEPEIDPYSESRPQKANPKVDPDEEEEDDDFGDFEDAQKECDDLGVHNKNKDLVELPYEALTRFKPQIEEHKGWGQSGHVASDSGPSGQDDEWGDFAGEEVIFDADRFDHTLAPTPKISTEKQQTHAPLKELDSDADDNWNPVEVSQAPIIPSKVSTTTANASTIKSAKGTILMASKKTLGPPPSNIPPPSVLLSAITSIFQSLSAKVKDIVMLNRAYSDPYEALDENQISALQKQISVTRASARIIAGRKLRWKRDTMLSQSMKIGPAGQTGMKLSSVDKLEARREDQEVSEAVHIWKKQIGTLRSTIARVNIHLPGEGLTISDISETIPVRAGKPSEGAVKAPKCCFLCGINRDERVAKVDVWVEDSFGEWWVEHWGHVDCVAFWEIVKEDLPQR